MEIKNKKAPLARKKKFKVYTTCLELAVSVRQITSNVQFMDHCTRHFMSEEDWGKLSEMKREGRI